MKHLNGHILCAIDCETSGLQAYHHDLLQIAIVPLDNKLEPRTDVLPFDILVKPRRPENLDPLALRKNKIKMADLVKAFQADYAADLFDDWFQKLRLPEGKKIVPLGYNWPFDREFIQDWMGWHSFNMYFHGHYRDVMQCACFMNDLAAYRIELCPYPKLELRYMCANMDIVWDDLLGHSAIYDCLQTLKVYKKLMERHAQPSYF